MINMSYYAEIPDIFNGNLTKPVLAGRGGEIGSGRSASGGLAAEVKSSVMVAIKGRRGGESVGEAEDF
jgi:hypothetical protein